MNKPWRHHSVAQMQLDWFADPSTNLLWHYDKRNPRRGVKNLGPKGIFWRRDQYSTLDYDTGEPDPSIEQFSIVRLRARLRQSSREL
jgi:hypothetical protein